jgi:hypothetical protein
MTFFILNNCPKGADTTFVEASLKRDVPVIVRQHRLSEYTNALTFRLFR